MNLQNELGKRRSLMVVKIVDFGVYLGTKDEKVLLPKKEVPAGIEVEIRSKYSYTKIHPTVSLQPPAYQS